jgi:hypothetical protein
MGRNFKVRFLKEKFRDLFHQFSIIALYSKLVPPEKIFCVVSGEVKFSGA